MARLEHIKVIDYRCEVDDGIVEYSPINRIVQHSVPQVFWADQTPWQEANLWAYERITCREVTQQTVEANMRGLAHYAQFLESQGLKWFEFPTRKAERCLVKYRGFLVDARSSGILSPATVTARMSYIIAFYRWAQTTGLLKSSNELWRDRTVFIKYFDRVGFERTLSRVTTDLSIPNRTRLGDTLEDGLLPVSASDRDRILLFAKDNASIELFLLLSAGFFTGMRLGTLCDLKIRSLEDATPDPSVPNMFHIAVGPGATTPVHTKFGVTGQVWITRELLYTLREYAGSARRLQREAKAEKKFKDLVFLTRFGNPYGREGSDKSSSINVELGSMRKRGIAHGLSVLRTFHFHQTRCTFGTELAKLTIKVGDEISALAFVRDALLHKDEATTFRYIKFLRNTPLKEEVSNAFTTAFMGIINKDAVDAAT